ncbi:MAG: LacI family transcriptional regulator [Candidatus Dormibacteraeota bacterium]|nr:LacI family transcriptional regulator [Candidatus Dormibacteraeota bacterium]
MVRQATRGSNVTISDVATNAGVSPTTVSRVLNGGYPVAKPTRAQVEKVVRELGYIRNAHAQALRGTSTGIVGVIIHDIADPYFSEIVAGIQEVAAENQRLVVLCNSLRNPASELQYVQMLRGQRVDAVILTGGAIEDAAYLRAIRQDATALKQQGARMVICGRYSSVTTPTVVPDNRRGGELLTNHLVGKGHRRIVEIMGPPNFSTTVQRSAGFRTALAAAGIDHDPSLSIHGSFTRESGYEAIRRLLASSARFTAVYAANDLMAVGALAALREAGLKVPGDVSLVGFDDIPTVRDVMPRLTTIRVPMREMGRRSMEIALGSGNHQPRVVVLPVELVERESVSRPPGRPGRSR